MLIEVERSPDVDGRKRVVQEYCCGGRVKRSSQSNWTGKGIASIRQVKAFQDH